MYRSLGSSPLARGLRRWTVVCCRGRRIIPARAGFTSAHSAAPPDSPDHPRSRGVYSTASHAVRRIIGSSPLARGLRRREDSVGQQRGIIPARAGFTSRPRHAASARPDHPRSRGVYAFPAVRQVSAVGSSPLARGLRGPAKDCGAAIRIIPARAGFTAVAISVWVVISDHPRSRGVYPTRI